MIVLRNFSLIKNSLGYGSGYAIGGVTGDIVGGAVGKKIKRKLNDKDIEEESKLSKSYKDFIDYHKDNDITEQSLRKYRKNDELMQILDENNGDDPDNFNYKTLNKNKNKILKGSQEKKEHHDRVIANPENYSGDQEKKGRVIGSVAGIAAGLGIAHKLMKK